MFLTPTKQKMPDSKTIIEEIHGAFYSEVDSLLAFARNIASTQTSKQPLLDKAERLCALGFYTTKEALTANSELSRIDAIKNQNDEKKLLKEAIDYFSFKYPLYKFITEDSVKRICEKYGLIYGAVDRFLGDVPDENLRQIEAFKVSREDECYIKTYTFLSQGSPDVSVVNVNEFDKLEGSSNPEEDTIRTRPSPAYTSSTTVAKCPLEIAAPRKDFNLTDAEVEGFNISEIEVEDPIVLQPVIHGCNKYYLIVTAWGEEAEDPEVLNHVLN